MTEVRTGGMVHEAHADALILPVFAGDAGLIGDAAEVNTALGGLLASVIAGRGWKAGVNSTLAVPTAAYANGSPATGMSATSGGVGQTADLGRSMAVREVVLVGLGRQEVYGPDAVRRAYGAGARMARDIGATVIAVGLPPVAGAVTPEIGVQAATEGVLLSLYQFSRYHTLDTPARAVDSVTFVGAEAAQTADAIRLGEAVAHGVMIARDLATEPGNALVPADLAAAARKIATENSLTYTEYGVEELTKMGAGALLAVGQGSANPPFLVHLTYEPAGGYTRTVAVIGKGITFDTGGISLKPSQNMEAMKHDMGGAATTLGVMAAVAQVAPKVRVFGIIATAENMPSDTAFRPGDVLTAMNGKTIEVISTDAEGRLVLADALVYAARHGADAMIDLATLTGGAVVALGTITTAVFANDDALCEEFLSAAATESEKAWQMPLDAEYRDQIKSDIADLKNSGGREASAVTAAKFLEEFTEGKPWVHLDIAGTVWDKKGNSFTPRGATGVHVRSLLRMLAEA